MIINHLTMNSEKPQDLENPQFDKSSALFYQEVSNDNQFSVLENQQYLSEELKSIQTAALAEKYNINQRALMKKIDLCLIPPFCILFFVSYLNKASFGFCLIDNISVSLKTDTVTLAGAYAAFFAPYLFFQAFSNVILKYIRPHFWISVTVLIYGCVGIGSAYVKDLPAFIGCQFVHGLFQSGTETAIYYILSHYYQKLEAQRRFSLIYTSSSIGGILTSVINLGATEHLDGMNGLENWRWLLLIEGAITLVAAVILFFTFPDFPEGARFFDDNETIFIVKKLELYGGKSGYNLNFGISETLKCLIDPLIFLPAILSFFVSFVAYSVNLLEPASLARVGYVGVKASKLTAIVWVVTLVWILINAFLSDRVKIRFPFFIFNCIIIFIGTILYLSNLQLHQHPKIKLAASVLLFMGSYAALPILICWSSMNLCGHLRKSIGISLEISLGSLGGLISYWVFVGKATKYTSGFIITCVFSVVSIILALVYTIYIKKLNLKKRNASYKEDFDKLSERSKIIYGDKDPHFDYMY